jgi:mRNA interferase MazF
MTLEPGALVLVPFPYTNLRSTKNRPAVVLSSSEYNAARRDVLVCGVTSNLANAAHSVLVSQRDLAQGHLMADSRIKADKLVTLQQSIVRKRLGRIKPGVLARVYRELAAVLPADAFR